MNDLLRTAGAVLIAISVIDVFLTVLYARSSAGLIAPFLSKGTWRLFRFVSFPLGQHQGSLLSFAGPIILVLIAAAWVLLLVLGFALLFWPELGSGLKKGIGPTPTGFITALYYSGFCLSTLGIGDIAPSSDATRLLSVVQAVLGFSFFTLTITYYLSVYSALHRRNTLASILHHMTSGQGDARLYVVSLGAGGSATAAARDFSDLASRTADLVEAHTFYPVLHFFHFRHLRYATPRMALLLLDAAALVKTLPISGGGKLQGSASQLETAVRDLLERLTETFISSSPGKYPPGEEDLEVWRGHFRETVRALQEAGADLSAGAEKGEERYLTLRKEWHPYIVALCESLGFEVEKVAPSSNPPLPFPRRRL
jgi:hypothetical protein